MSKSFRKKFGRGKLKGEVVVYTIDVPPALWDRWVQLNKDLEKDNPSEIVELHLDNYLRRISKRKEPNVKIRQYQPLNVAVSKPMVRVLSVLASSRFVKPQDVILAYMRKILNSHKVHAERKLLKSLERMEKNKDLQKKLDDGYFDPDKKQID